VIEQIVGQILNGVYTNFLQMRSVFGSNALQYRCWLLAQVLEMGDFGRLDEGEFTVESVFRPSTVSSTSIGVS
jgi:hypothetical protein